MAIRPAVIDDLPAIFDIFNREIRESVAIFDTVEVTPEKQREWFEARRNLRHPAIVFEEGGETLGVAWLSAWSAKCGYARAAEVSVYVRRDAHGRGVGKALLEELARLGREAGLGVLLARIESTRDVSLRLHESQGFRRIGVMNRVGEKFGEILDVVVLEKHLDGWAG